MNIEIYKNDGTIEVKTVPDPEPVYKTIDDEEVRLLLLQLGKTEADVLAAIDQFITDPIQNAAAKIKFERRKEIHRDDDLVQQLAPLLGLTDAQIDTVFGLTDEQIDAEWY